MVLGASNGTRYLIIVPPNAPLIVSLFSVPGIGSTELLKNLNAIGCVSGTSVVSK